MSRRLDQLVEACCGSKDTNPAYNLLSSTSPYLVVCHTKEPPDWQTSQQDDGLDLEALSGSLQ